MMDIKRIPFSVFIVITVIVLFLGVVAHALAAYKNEIQQELTNFSVHLNSSIDEQQRSLMRFKTAFSEESADIIAERIYELEPQTIAIQYIDESGKLAYLESGVTEGSPVPLLPKDTILAGGISLPVGTVDGKYYLGIAIPGLGIGIETLSNNSFGELEGMNLRFYYCSEFVECNNLNTGEVKEYQVGDFQTGYLLRSNSWMLIQAEERLHNKVLYLINAVLPTFLAILLIAATVYLTFMTHVNKLKHEEYEKDLARSYDSSLGIKNSYGLSQDITDWRSKHRGLPILYVIESDNLQIVQTKSGDSAIEHIIKTMRDRLIATFGTDHIYRLENYRLAILLDENMQAITGTDVRSLLNKEYKLREQTYCMTHSIGVAAMLPGESKHQLLKHAQIALYEARKRRNTVHKFCEEINEQYQSRVELEQSLARAISNGEIFVNYQAQVDENHRLFGVEALARWKHPKHGLISPASFIPIAESAGLMPALGKVVYRQAILDISKISEELRMDIPLSVNVSTREFLIEGFVENMVALAKEFKFKPNLLTLEITESMEVEDWDAFQEVVERLKEAGFRLSLDDFGTGYSSLNLLAKLPLDEVKIDRSFVVNAQLDNAYSLIIGSTISIAKRMGVDVVCEGIENVSQRQLLETLGSTAYQGFLYCRPCDIVNLLLVVRDLERCRNTADKKHNVTKLIASN
ncbi:bifunctional diguanylate cyclase/phosphodiesterase [Vibrio alginolyticus]|uniref:bifunctional diguanylate cyclase/phosphodiesterase n=1 Tax=Vibrio alginolyticus TaxID=663 RepID=UPI0015F51ED2|nr:GGDEF domain-containing phosphodiesterase [Vibrio alginolyticus]